MRSPVAPPFDRGAIPSACHCICSSLRSSAGLGSDAQATPLHSSASAPAACQLGSRSAGANDRALVRLPNAASGLG